MGDFPFLQLYTSDWRADPALRLCSLAARGLWIEMICLMHQSDPYGQLTINGIQPSETALASLVGASGDETKALLFELEKAGVFLRKKNGAIYSKRMESDENKRRKKRENGKKGGNPSLLKQTENHNSDNHHVKLRDQKPETRV